MSGTLIQFLRARYAEDATQQQNVFEKWHHRDCEAVPDVLSPDVETGACTCGVPERVLTEIEAARQAIAHYERVAARRQQHPEYELAAGAVEVQLKIRALPYASHPDYRREWAP